MHLSQLEMTCAIWSSSCYFGIEWPWIGGRNDRYNTMDNFIVFSLCLAQFRIENTISFIKETRKNFFGIVFVPVYEHASKCHCAQIRTPYISIVGWRYAHAHVCIWDLHLRQANNKREKRRSRRKAPGAYPNGIRYASYATKSLSSTRQPTTTTINTNTQE